MIRYAEAFPADLDRSLARQAPIIWPLGALEWHGNHLPLGTDGFLATEFAERLADAVDGVLLPTAWIPMTTLPHRHSLDVRPATFQALVEDQVRSLRRAGWNTVAIVSGHYAQGQEIVLYRSARGLMTDTDGLRVFVGAPLELLGDEQLDHAGHNEASQLLSCHPDLVRLEHPTPEAVIGMPPETAGAHEGRTLISAALDEWQSWMDAADAAALATHYDAAEARYRPYVDRYFRGDWDEAIRAWWSDRCAGM